MCCGAGNLACAIAVPRRPTARVWATDLTDGCVGWTRRNVEHLGLGDRVDGRAGRSVRAVWPVSGSRARSTVVCNPPYISTGRLAGDRATLLEHEPREAFDGGPYGLTIHQRVMREAVPFLKPGGWLLFEIGLGQERQVWLLFDARARPTRAPSCVTDEAGNARVAVGRMKERSTMERSGDQGPGSRVHHHQLLRRRSGGAARRGVVARSQGIIDSTGVLEVIGFIESTFGISVEDAEMLPENLDGIERLTAFVARKQSA